MPGGDRTGPLGMGPMTGRGFGYCGGNPAPGYASVSPRRGFWGRGRGGGRGRRNWFYATGLTGWQRDAMGIPPTGFGPPFAMPAGDAGTMRAQEVGALDAYLQYLEQTAESVRQRIDRLRAEVAEKSATPGV